MAGCQRGSVFFLFACPVALPCLLPHLLVAASPVRSSTLLPLAGKSTAIQRAVQKKCQAKGAVGVVHYKVPEQPSQFSLGLAAALGQRLDSFSEEGAVKRFYRKLTGKQETFESNKTWARLRDCLLAGARAFREKHGRPAVLVIDGVEVLATYEHWHFLEGLQKFAELAAADDSLIIVFVVG